MSTPLNYFYLLISINLISFFSYGFKIENIDSLIINWKGTYEKKELNNDDIKILSEYSGHLYNNHLLTETYLNLERILFHANKTQDTLLLCKTKINIGILLYEIGAGTEAKSYLKEGLKFSLIKKDTTRIIIARLNLATLFVDEKHQNLDSAYYQIKRARKLINKLNNKEFIVLANDKLIAYYLRANLIDKALVLITKNIALKNEINVSTKDNHYQRIIALKKKKLINSPAYIKELKNYVQRAKEEDNRIALKQGYLLLNDFYIKNNNKIKAYDFLNKIYSIEKLEEIKKFNDEHILIFERVKNLNFKQLQKQRESNHKLQLKLEKTKTKNEAEKAQQYLIFLISIIIAIVIITYFLTRIIKQIKTIEKSKLKLETQHKEITSSITYAKRIQNALLPSTKSIETTFKDYFLIYIPKDIVSGDFYWLEESKNKIHFAVADCTGHGVPGAMVSVICNNGLNKSVREHKLVKPNQILDKTREIIIKEFEKSGENIKDGMDISLISIDKANNLLEFSGAHSSAWIVRQKEGTHQLIELKGDKQPIGNFEKSFPFNNQHFNLLKGDTIYLYSDGYADQFGGKNNKKIKNVNFKKLLLDIQDLDLKTQKEELQTFFINWKGDYEQLDDVCVVGIKI